MRKGEGSNLQSLILLYTIIQRKALRLDSFPLLPRAWLIRTDRIIPWAWLPPYKIKSVSAAFVPDS